MKQSSTDILIIGAGPAGLIAGARAAECGATVVILEKMDQPAMKLRITGKGRCNITNSAEMEDFLTHFSPNPRFLKPAFYTFFNTQLLEKLERLNVPTVVERGGRVFPVSQSAKDVAEALIKWGRESGVKVWTNACVSELVVSDGEIRSVTLKDGQTIEAKSVIIATGGVSYPGTGSSGDGYRLAKSVGHTITPVRPALVPLLTEGTVAQSMQGLSLKNVTASLWVDEKKQADDFGEMIFTHFGLSGPIILTLSRKAVIALDKRQSVEICLDLKPALDETKLDTRLIRELNTHGKQQFKSILKGLLPQKMIPVCADVVEISLDKPASQISGVERKALLRFLKNFRFTINGHRGLKEAIVTAGGVSIKEIDSKTMASKLLQGLYFAGEVLDIDADTGGYNLQAAFSTGWLAGQSSAHWFAASSDSIGKV
ncbi:NAD(P)/FAD-dependent oxidoreductase [candidate division KSB1 bacterium]|nr:NAD(P)/FAD-dependent oxidoreductase [candidate division KSB1 bacterium]